MRPSIRIANLVLLTICVWSNETAAADAGIFLPLDQSSESAGVLSNFLEAHPVKRYQLVSVDVQQLRKTISKFEQPVNLPSCCPLRFRLFDDLAISLYTYRVRAEWLEAWHWSGVDSVDGDTGVTALLTITIGDAVTGYFYGLGGRYKIEPLDRLGTHIVWQSKSINTRID